MGGMQEIFANYNDMLQEISILEEQILLAEKEKERWWIGGDLFHKQHLRLDQAADRVDKLNDKLDKMYKRIKELYESKKRIDRMMAHFEGLEYKVAYYKLVKGMSLQQIADEMGYSYQYIKEVSARLGRTYQQPTDVLKNT